MSLLDQVLCCSSSSLNSTLENHWHRLIEDSDEELLDILKHGQEPAQLAKSRTEEAEQAGPSLWSLLRVFCAAAFAVKSTLAPPLRWTAVERSALALNHNRVSSPASSSAAPQRARRLAAHLLAQVVEEQFLVSVAQAAQLVSHLHRCSVVGLPLLALVLRAYSYSLTVVLQDEIAYAGDRCLTRLHIALQALAPRRETQNWSRSEGGTAGDGISALTVVHATILHTARVTQQFDVGLSLLRKPCYCTDPVVNGVALHDILSYYLEAALMLAEMNQYERAFLSLLPIVLIPDHVMFGKDDQPREAVPEMRSGSSTAPAAASRKGGLAAEKRCLSESTTTLSLAARYPLYRVKESVRSKAAVLSPCSPIELEIATPLYLHAWKLLLLFLAAGFGGGIPSIVVEQLGSQKWQQKQQKKSLHHRVFANPDFLMLRQLGNLQLSSLLQESIVVRSAVLEPYRQLLLLVSRRSVSEAALMLHPTHSFTGTWRRDDTVAHVAAALQHRLLHHFILDLANVYFQLPLRTVLHRLTADTKMPLDRQADFQPSSSLWNGAITMDLVMKALGEMVNDGRLAAGAVVFDDNSTSRMGDSCRTTTTAATPAAAAFDMPKNETERANAVVYLQSPTVAMVLRRCYTFSRCEVPLESEPSAAEEVLEILSCLRQLEAAMKAMETQMTSCLKEGAA